MAHFVDIHSELVNTTIQLQDFLVKKTVSSKFGQALIKTMFDSIPSSDTIDFIRIRKIDKELHPLIYKETIDKISELLKLSSDDNFSPFLILTEKDLGVKSKIRCFITTTPLKNTRMHKDTKYIDPTLGSMYKVKDYGFESRFIILPLTHKGVTIHIRLPICIGFFRY